MKIESLPLGLRNRIDAAWRERGYAPLEEERRIKRIFWRILQFALNPLEILLLMGVYYFTLHDVIGTMVLTWNWVTSILSILTSLGAFFLVSKNVETYILSEVMLMQALDTTTRIAWIYQTVTHLGVIVLIGMLYGTTHATLLFAMHLISVFVSLAAVDGVQDYVGGIVKECESEEA